MSKNETDIKTAIALDINSFLQDGGPELQGSIDENMAVIKQLYLYGELNRTVCYWCIGKLVRSLQENFDEFKVELEEGESVVERVGKVLKRKTSFVYNCLAFYSNWSLEDLGMLSEYVYLQVSHVMRIAKVEDRKARIKLLKRAEKEKLTVAEVAREVKQLNAAPKDPNSGGKDDDSSSTPKQKEPGERVSELGKLENRVADLFSKTQKEIEKIQDVVTDLQEQELSDEDQEAITDKLTQVRQDTAVLQQGLQNVNNLDLGDQNPAHVVFQQLRDALQNMRTEVQSFFPRIEESLHAMIHDEDLDDVEYDRALATFKQAAQEAAAMGETCTKIQSNYRDIEDDT